MPLSEQESNGIAKRRVHVESLGSGNIYSDTGFKDTYETSAKILSITNKEPIVLRESEMDVKSKPFGDTISNGQDGHENRVPNHQSLGDELWECSKEESLRKRNSVCGDGPVKPEGGKPDTAKNGHRGEEKTDEELQLLQWEDMPRHLQFNPYVKTGYRPLLSAWGCVHSLSYLHNETVNILTHGESHFITTIKLLLLTVFF